MALVKAFLLQTSIYTKAKRKASRRRKKNLKKTSLNPTLHRGRIWWDRHQTQLASSSTARSPTDGSIVLLFFVYDCFPEPTASVQVCKSPSEPEFWARPGLLVWNLHFCEEISAGHCGIIMHDSAIEDYRKLIGISIKYELVPRSSIILGLLFYDFPYAIEILTRMSKYCATAWDWLH